MQYAKQNTLKAFFSFFFLWATILFSHKTSIAATESNLWIANNVAEKEKIETAFNTQKTEGLHLFSHGKSGELWLDGTWKNAEQIAVWLTHKQDIQQKNQLNVYGCEFAKGEKGKAAVQYLEETLGICVAASDDITGIDGDWELEVGYSTNKLHIEDYGYNLQVCNCVEFIYLNEPDTGPNADGVGVVHKFQVDPNTHILTEIGDPWNNTVGLYPHGAALDLNGFVYIGATGSGPVIKLDCDGNIQNDFTPFDTKINTSFTIGNIHYTNYENGLNIHDLCTGQHVADICLTIDGVSVSNIWGIHYNENTEMFYAQALYTGEKHAVFVWDHAQNEDAMTNGTCIEYSFNGTPNGGNAWGIVSDNDGNIYTMVSSSSFWVFTKYDPIGNILAEVTSIDLPDMMYFPQGVTYSSSADLLFIAVGGDGTDTYDCISAFDTTLTYVGTAVPNPPGGSAGVAKAIQINTECCPNPLTQIIDQTYCETTTGEKLYLNEIFLCDGIVCGAEWIPDAGNTGMTYDECDQSITITDAQACGTFTKQGSNAQCGTFDLTYNVEILTPASIEVSADTTICAGSTVTLNATGNSNSFQWQISTDGCEGTWTDIDGAIDASYTTAALSDTSYYRVVSSVNGNCSTGTCSLPSACITVNVEKPTLSIDGATCDAGDTTYTIDFTSDGTVTSTAGTVAGNQVIDIPAGTDATITATLNGCTSEETVVSPDCGSNCPTTKCMKVILTKTN